MPQSDPQYADPRPAAQRPADTRSAARTGPGGPPVALRVIPLASRPHLDGPTRVRLGHALRALYDPVIDEALDPRLAELLQQLDADRAGTASR